MNKPHFSAKRLATSALLMGVAICGTASAAVMTTPVDKVGCYLTNNTCIAWTTAPIPGPAACNNKTSIRWDGTTTRGQEITRIMTAAKLSGANVAFDVASTCYASDTTYPTLVWARIE